MVLEFVGHDVPQLWRAYARKYPDAKPKLTMITPNFDILNRARAGTDADVGHPAADTMRDFSVERWGELRDAEAGTLRRLAEIRYEHSQRYAR